MKSKRAFTLIEVMVAIVLIALASGVVAFNMRGAIEKKKFRSDLERLRARLTLAQKLALAMESDWKGVLKKEPGGWVFATEAEGVDTRKVPPLHLGQIEISFNGKPVRELTIDFFATGLTLPEGDFVFVRGAEKAEWKISEILVQ